MDNPFNITREEVMELAASKVVSACCDDANLNEIAERMIREKISEDFAKKTGAKIDKFLTDEMERLLRAEIVPVDMWGEKTGSPTTIRDQLAERAKKFWEVKVNENGTESSWGGTPRSHALMATIMKDEFAKAVKENAEVIIAAFKTAITDDSVRLVTGHIDKLINVRTK